MPLGKLAIALHVSQFFDFALAGLQILLLSKVDREAEGDNVALFSSPKRPLTGTEQRQTSKARGARRVG